MGFLAGRSATLSELSVSMDADAEDDAAAAASDDNKEGGGGTVDRLPDTSSSPELLLSSGFARFVVLVVEESGGGGEAVRFLLPGLDLGLSRSAAPRDEVVTRIGSTTTDAPAELELDVGRVLGLAGRTPAFWHARSRLLAHVSRSTIQLAAQIRTNDHPDLSSTRCSLVAAHHSARDDPFSPSRFIHSRRSLDTSSTTATCAKVLARRSVAYGLRIIVRLRHNDDSLHARVLGC